MDSINKVAYSITDTTPPTGPQPHPDGWVTRGERLAQEVNKLLTAEDAASTFELLTDQHHKAVLWNIVELENKDDDLGVVYNIIQNKPMALQFLKMFDSEKILN